jgi:importin subunit alpha-2
MWAIANIAGDSSAYRNMCLDGGALENIVDILANTDDRQVIKIGIWALANLCRGKDPPAFNQVYKSVSTFVRTLKTETN